ncbi:MAG TPA: ROK family protein [Puia sp.]|nr:ROK family protein [Puia sp.]
MNPTSSIGPQRSPGIASVPGSPVVIGIDLGATNIRGAVVSSDSLSEITATRIHSDGSVEAVLQDIGQVIETLLAPGISAIGIGVPSVVDVEQGIVYDVQYIPSWKEVHLKKLLEARYNIPVFVNNDANCFALGEYYFGKGRGASSMVGLTIGTGLGGGIIIHDRLFEGYNCGAGEFGCLPYKDNILEYYCSGSFFKNVYNLDGTQVYAAARKGDAKALHLYAELGTHIGNAIKAVMYTCDPELIILGGSVSQAYDLFGETMWSAVKTLFFGKSAERIRIETSNLENSGILGAAALYYNAQN